MLTALAVSVASMIAYKFGKRRGEEDMYYLCKSADQARREFFSSVSLN